MSFVKGQAQSHFHVLARFIGGFALSATAVFASLGALGEAIPLQVTDQFAKQVVVFLLLAAAVVDVRDVYGGSSYSRLSCQRQTPADVSRRLGMRRAALAWGLDAGLGFTTYRVSAAYWVVVACAIAGLAPWWIGAAYALGFLAPLTVGCSAALLLSGDSSTVRVAELIRNRSRAARLAGLAVITVCVVALAPALS